VTPPVLMETSKTYFISLCVRSIEGLWRIGRLL